MTTTQTFALPDLKAEREQSGRLYLEFLRVPSLSTGLYELPAGSTDPQQPHSEDEVYYVVSGRASFRSGDEDYPVGPGSVLYVAANVPHRFHTIEEDLSIVVFFAPAQHTHRT